jgi:C_GCAxxG_C_C family probable redox protein
VKVGLFGRKPDSSQTAGMEDLPHAVGLRAENLFRSGQVLCTEAVLLTLNSGLRGDLPPEYIYRLASGLPLGMGGAGCVCGALSGASLGLGLFLGPPTPDRGASKRLRGLTKELHDRFKASFGATCCRVLSRELQHDPRAHFQQCSMITGRTAQIATDIILRAKPELSEQVDMEFLTRRDSRVGAGVRRIVAQLQNGRG